MPLCFLCKTDFPSVDALYLHLKIRERVNEYAEFKCQEKNCWRDFANWKTFRKHLIKNHKYPTYVHPSGNESILLDTLSEEIELAVDSKVSNEKSSDVSDISNKEGVTIWLLNESVRNNLLTFISKLYANPNLPRNHIQLVIDDFHQLLSEAMGNLKPLLFNILMENISKDVKEKVEKVLTVLTEPFQDVYSEYHRLKIFQEMGHYIPPQSYVIGSRIDNKLFQNRIIKEIVSVTAQFIPMRKVLYSFFSLPGVLQKTIEYVKQLKIQEDLSNFVQGEIWREKESKYFVGKDVLPIFLYYDDFEVNNPLGSHAGIQKVGGVYFSIPCIPPEYTAKLENIFLCLLFYSSDRDTYSNESIFQIVVDEINYLQNEGITFEINGSKITIYFALGLLLGDNLALNSALGYVSSFRANHYCRFYKASRPQMELDCKIQLELQRKPEHYMDDVSVMNPSVTGIKELSVWSKVQYFNIYSNYSSDILHDVKLGVLKYGMGHIVYEYIIKRKTFSLRTLNERIDCFNYKRNKFRNKSPLISADEVKERKIKMSASEIQTFFTCFAFYVGDLVQYDDLWSYYIILRKIVDLQNAKCLQRGAVKLLETLTTEHHRLYQEIFADTLKPKFHNILHYFQILLKSGPLHHLNCLRYESKNRFLKLIASGTSSRRNILHTMAVKEQLNLCYRLMCKKDLEEHVLMGPASLISDISCLDKYHLFSPSLPTEFKFRNVEVSWIEKTGIKYSTNSCVVLSLDLQYLPVFGTINTIICNEIGHVCFICEVWLNIGYDEQLHAYEVLKSESYVCWLLCNLHSPFPAIFHKMPNGEYYVALKASI